MDSEQIIKTIKKVITLLKLTDFSMIVGRTNNGELAYKIPKDGDPYYTLDSVPVTKEIENDLKEILETK